MKLCFSTLGCPEKSLDEILKLAKDYGFSSIELRGFAGELLPSLIPEFHLQNIEKTKQKFFESKVKPISLDLSFSCNEAGKNDQEINKLIPELDIAKALDIPYIRIFGNEMPQVSNEAYEEVLYALKGACHLASERDLTILLEVHGDFNTIQMLDPIIQEMKDNAHFGIIWDIAHTDIPYGDNWREFYDYIMPFTKHVHIKDHRRHPHIHTPLGKGDIPIKEIMKTLANDGFDGYFSLEWEKRWHPELSELDEALEDFIAIASEIG